MKKNALPCLGISALIFALDQLSKYWLSHTMQEGEVIAICPGFNLRLAFNRGAAFSLLGQSSGWQQWLFGLIALFVSIGIIIWLYRTPRHHYVQAIALALILGGAVGNLFDRIVHGYVIDFLEIYFKQWYWPAFNIADSAVVVGVILLIGVNFLKKERA